MVVVAQLVRAPGCGPGGRGFKSHLAPHFFAPILGKKITKTQVFTSRGEAALHSKAAGFSSHLHQIPEALLACPAIARRATADEDAPFHSACEGVPLSLHL